MTAQSASFKRDVLQAHQRKQPKQHEIPHQNPQHHYEYVFRVPRFPEAIRLQKRLVYLLRGYGNTLRHRENRVFVAFELVDHQALSQAIEVGGRGGGRGEVPSRLAWPSRQNIDHALTEDAVIGVVMWKLIGGGGREDDDSCQGCACVAQPTTTNGHSSLAIRGYYV